MTLSRRCSMGSMNSLATISWCRSASSPPPTPSQVSFSWLSLFVIFIASFKISQLELKLRWCYEVRFITNRTVSRFNSSDFMILVLSIFFFSLRKSCSANLAGIERKSFFATFHKQREIETNLKTFWMFPASDQILIYILYNNCHFLKSKMLFLTLLWYYQFEYIFI